MSSQNRARYSVTTVGASSVTLTPVAGLEDEDRAGDPMVYGTGTIVINTTGTPSPTFWATGRKFIVALSRVD